MKTAMRIEAFVGYFSDMVLINSLNRWVNLRYRLGLICERRQMLTQINLSARPIPAASRRGIWRAEPRASFLEEVRAAARPHIPCAHSSPWQSQRGILGAPNK